MIDQPPIRENGLTLITTPRRHGKTRYLVENLQEYLGSDSKLTACLVVPNKPMAECVLDQVSLDCKKRTTVITNKTREASLRGMVFDLVLVDEAAYVKNDRLEFVYDFLYKENRALFVGSPREVKYTLEDGVFVSDCFFFDLMKTAKANKYSYGPSIKGVDLYLREGRNFTKDENKMELFGEWVTKYEGLDD